MSLFEEQSRELLPYDGSAVLHEWVLGDRSWTSIMTTLTEAIPWESHTIRMFGKEYPQPRLVAWFGDPHSEYSYSGLAMTVRPWIPVVQDLREIAERHAGVRFNSVLLNLYRNGDDKVSWHRDNEPELGATPTIASMSLGAVRRFKFRHLDSKEVVSVDLAPGSLVVMSGLSQTCWEHEVPRQAAVSDSRINLTFR
ncbi:MAG: alpha-ketoglutarate-dependent dioxygenase AlkB, partial [Actinomycetota bacterium]|nr:alpha-ketoglutarate-dependent dioxygenase AlkB [Actinomycetota bacterium]